MRPPGSVLTRAPGHCRGYAGAAVLAAGVALAGGVLSGCSGPRSGISVRSSVDACAAALPVARVAVHRRGTLMGVHALHRGALRKLADELGLPPPPSPSSVPVSGSAPATTSAATASTTAARPTTVRSGTSLPPEPEPRGCLVVFHGTYRAHTVDHPIGDPSGPYAIALVRLHKARLIVVIVADTLPESLEK